MNKLYYDNYWYLIKVSLLFLLVLLSKSCETDSNESDLVAEKPLVLLISVDGFAYDYFDRAETPTFDSLINEGAKAEALVPVFPSKTFPNHYTQVTGLYPENHGIISNRMYDPNYNQYFTIGSQSTTANQGKWYQGEPIWATAKKQGLLTATMFWPGSDAEINGVRPDYYYAYNGAISPDERIDQVIRWLELGSTRPQLITLYFEDVDHAGHLYGPHSRALELSVTSIDQHLGKLMQAISFQGLAQKINIIIMSDHGMASVSRDRVIFLDDFINLGDVEIVNWSPVAEIIPALGEEQLIFDQLINAHQRLKAYRKGSILPRWHFNHHYRITPIVAVADIGWSITSSDYFDEHPQAYRGGAHGYDPAEPAMGGIFVASGPDFRSGASTNAVEAVHLYELLCYLLRITPSENDGKLEVWQEVLD